MCVKACQFNSNRSSFGRMNEKSLKKSLNLFIIMNKFVCNRYKGDENSNESAPNKINMI